VRSKSGKYLDTRCSILDTRYLMSRAAKLRGGLRTGFTLIEILVAAAIIVTIVSMVYGSYFATAKSTDVYKVRMTLSGQTRKVLGQMARQIRCSYVGKIVERTDSAGTISRGKRKIPESPIRYFNCEPDAHGGEILHLVTTNGLFCQEGQADGLFDVTYKFDKNSGTLYLSQRRFVGNPDSLIEKRNWRPILRNVECVELDFFDGKQWLPVWNFIKQKRTLPYAVKIGITSRVGFSPPNSGLGGASPTLHYGTIAFIGCSGNQGRRTSSETLVSVSR